MFIGNPHIISFFERALQKEELSHCYLFVGPQSVGKTHLALQVARFLACKHPLSLKEFSAQKKECPCNACSAIARSTHPDILLFLDPLVIENIRMLKKQLAQSPLVSIYRIVIIKNIEKTTLEATQALIKLLEEPSASTIFFLTAEHISSLPSTIASRSAVLRFSLVCQKEMQQLISSRENSFSAANERAKQQSFLVLAPYWRGRPGRLLRLINDKTHVQRITDEKKRAENFLHSSLAQRFSITEHCASLERQEALATLEEWMLWWEDARAFQPLRSLCKLHQTLAHTPINIQTSLEYLALAMNNKTAF